LRRKSHNIIQEHPSDVSITTTSGVGEIPVPNFKTSHVNG